MATDLRRRGFAEKVIGVEKDPVNAEAALKMGLVDEIVPFAKCVEDSDLIVVATPVGDAVKMVCAVLDLFKENGWTERHSVAPSHDANPIWHAPRLPPCALPQPPFSWR